MVFVFLRRFCVSPLTNIEEVTQVISRDQNIMETWMNMFDLDHFFTLPLLLFIFCHQFKRSFGICPMNFENTCVCSRLDYAREICLG